MEVEEVVKVEVEEVISDNTPPKEKRVKSKSPGESNEDPAYWHLVFIRNTRNSYLSLTDKYILPDYPITPEKLEIIKVYRQHLRDFMNNNTEALLNGEKIEIDPIPSL